MDSEVEAILNKNKLQDLQRFIDKRQCLNSWNVWLTYLFHIVQTGGILTTAIAQGYDEKDIVWLGVGLNFLASLLQIFEHTNNSMSKRMLENIKSIKNGTYVDEGVLVEIQESQPKKQNNESASGSASSAGPVREAVVVDVNQTANQPNSNTDYV